MKSTLRILLVEDSEDDAFLLFREIKSSGYGVESRRVETAGDLIQSLKDESWDIVITDHNLPGFDSSAALAIVREHDVDLPVIIVSGSIGEDIAVEAMKSGAHDYIMKGQMARLVPAIERELREAESRKARRKAEEAIHHMAFHDMLTGLVNRHEFEHRLRELLEHARKTDSVHALLYLDLDQFKIINDTCGHVAGDELLRQLSRVLQHNIRGKDVLARLGGDEFCALLENCPMERAQVIAESLRKAIKDFRFVWEDRVFTVGVSIGVVPITSSAIDAGELLSKADLACYAAKDNGRNCVQVYCEENQDFEDRRGEMNWVSRIDHALENNRFVLYQQPITPINGVHDQHFELLIRMLDENDKIIPPGAFIPAAERYDRMQQIDHWVIQAACKHMAELNGHNKSIYTINLSGSSLGDEGLLDYVEEMIKHYKIASEKVCFEITETAAISNFRHATDFINRMKGFGCQFALDDFGSGLSSFSYLKSLHVDYLKIDGGFVKNITEDPMDRAIVESINQIGHAAGLETIAEFVENDNICDVIRRIGVDYAQGYGIGRPEPIFVPKL